MLAPVAHVLVPAPFQTPFPTRPLFHLAAADRSRQPPHPESAPPGPPIQKLFPGRANVVTHSDGRLLHGIGGWQNCLFAGCTILAVPSYRDRITVIVDQVTTLTGPGELVDVVATERGIAINPRRQDLLDALVGSDLPIRPIEDIKAEVEQICGGPPARPRLTDEPVAVVKWVDGTVIDTGWKVGG
jgi:citrate lyase alpha subunit